MSTLMPNEIVQPDEATAWAAVANRDRRFDGKFVYAVRTTRVYCRPSCPSRRPLRANVIFYATRSSAEAAGFRACPRCKGSAAIGREQVR
jgi:AraC family transcriptional regulator of adaptative response/methylated-DNA-[protein]-cysteine methyltransferase